MRSRRSAARRAERRHFVTPPPAQVCGTTEEIALEERHLDSGGPNASIDPMRACTAATTLRPSDRNTRSSPVSLVVIPGAREPLPGLFEMDRGHVAALRIEQVVGRVPCRHRG